MKGKYLKQEDKKKKSFPWLVIVLIVAVVLAAAVILWYGKETPADEINPSESETAGDTQAQAATEPGTVPSEQEMASIYLGYGLYLDRIDSYTGAYVEDGSNEVVSDVMMALVTNTAEQDLQYAKIVVSYSDTTYNFEVSDLPAGTSAVLLEKGRQTKPDGNPVSATSELVAFFSENMSVHEDIFEISGMDGTLNIRNISDTDITGKIYVHYKYMVQDFYYGGISFRIEIDGGLKTDEIRQITTGHYNPDNCVIVAVEYTS